MIFGEKRFNQNLFTAIALSLLWIAVLFQLPLVMGIQGPLPDKSHEYPAFTLEKLTDSLSLQSSYHVAFEETYVSQLLTAPILKSGTLRYTAPSKFEKHIEAPRKESFVIDEDTVHYTNRSRGIDQTLSLQDIPALQIFIVGLRSLFLKDLTSLQAHYRIELHGTLQQWELTMVPLDEDIQESVKFLSIRGITQTIREIEIHESNGDYSTLFLKNL